MLLNNDVAFDVVVVVVVFVVDDDDDDVERMNECRPVRRGRCGPWSKFRANYFFEFGRIEHFPVLHPLSIDLPRESSSETVSVDGSGGTHRQGYSRRQLEEDSFSFFTLLRIALT